MFRKAHVHKLRDRRVAILATLAVAALAAISVPRADATLSAVGPTSQPTGGFPRYFTDSTNQRLELCLDQSGNCLATFPDPASPPSLPDNFPDESFWFDATSDVAIPGPNGVAGQALLTLAVEAAFANGDAIDGDQTAFTRVRLRVRGGFPNQDYTLSYPYGSRKLRTDSNGNVSFTSDIGCFTFPCDWSQVLRGEVGPWLKWDPAVAPAAPAGYLGDPNVIHKIVGSPTGRNYFRVNGGGNTGLPQPTNASPGGVQNDLFAIQGKIDTGPDPAPPPAPAAVASFQPTSLNYAPRDVGTTSVAQTTTLTNTGNAAMSLSPVQIQGTNPGDFSITSNTCTASLAQSASCSVSVAFSPAAPGTRVANLTFTDDAAGSPQTVALTGSGNGLPAPIATLAPSTGMTFASQNIGTTSTAQTATMTNTGSASMSVNDVAVTGPGAADYVLTNGCTAPLAVNASCNVSVAFKPTAVGTRSASLVFTDTAAGSPHSISLTGTGQTPPAAAALSMSASSVDFGSRNTGTTSPAQDVTLTNAGTASMDITSIAVTGTDVTDFAETTTCGTSLAAGANCTISVTFSPSATGPRNASVSIVDSAPGNPHSIALTGTGTTPPAQAPDVAITPSALVFGDQAEGTVSPAKSVSVQNTGTGALVINTTRISGADFAPGANDTCAGHVIDPGLSCTVDVRFIPVSTGAKSGTLTITDNTAAGVHTVGLSGNATSAAAPLAVLSATSLAYGSQAVGTTSVAKTVTMTNTGNAAMSLSYALQGTFPGDYVLSPGTTPCGTTLPAGASCSINVAFKPAATGSRPAVLHFTDNSGNVASSQDVTLSGTGTAPAISATPNPLAFGSVRAPALLSAGSSLTKTLTVSNPGSAPLAITTTTIGAAASSSFPGDYSAATATNTCAGRTVAAGGTCTIAIKFAPKARGTRNAVLTIASNAPTGALKVNLTGTGS